MIEEEDLEVEAVEGVEGEVRVGAIAKALEVAKEVVVKRMNGRRIWVEENTSMFKILFNDLPD
jgi:1,2-phenylacetyl-CoA epoxidase PaaB subunit